jgi:hypothetical protein
VKASTTGNCARNYSRTWILRYRFRFAGDHGLVNIGDALNDHAIRRNAGSGPDQNDVANMQLRKRDLFRICTLHPFGGIREQGSKCIERAARLENSPHFELVTKDHDRNQ